MVMPDLIVPWRLSCTNHALCGGDFFFVVRAETNQKGVNNFIYLYTCFTETESKIEGDDDDDTGATVSFF